MGLNFAYVERFHGKNTDNVVMRQTDCDESLESLEALIEAMGKIQSQLPTIGLF
jgi:hypothetical protein